jgi:hypothetical protein
MNRYRQNYADYILKDYATKVQIYLPGASSKSPNYDKFRDVGFVKATQNPICVKSWVRDTSANELIVRQLGLIMIGAKKLIVKNNDVNLFRIASRVVIDDIDFYVFADAVGKKMQIMPLDENYSEITVFKKDI